MNDIKVWAPIVALSYQPLQKHISSQTKYRSSSSTDSTCGQFLTPSRIPIVSSRCLLISRCLISAVVTVPSAFVFPATPLAVAATGYTHILVLPWRTYRHRLCPPASMAQEHLTVIITITSVTTVISVVSITSGPSRVT